MNNEEKQNEERMEDFESYFEESCQQYRAGAEVKGQIVEIKGDIALINFGYKTEGIVNISELEDAKLGDEVILSIVKISNDGVFLSKKAINARSDWSAIKEKETNNQPVEVKITEYVNTDKVKGFRGKIGEIDAFIRENQISDRLKDIDPKSYIQKTLLAKIVNVYSGKKRSVLVSPREYLFDEAKKLKEEFFEKYNVGDRVKGTVKTLKSYGAFINFGAIDGFLHRNEMSWGRVGNPAKILSENENVEVEILEMDRENQKIAVGMKQLQKDPWEDVAVNYPEGSSVKGTIVARRKRAGYVVSIVAGIDGFVPNEEVSWFKNQHPAIKDIVEGIVTGYDNERKRVMMSIKDLQDNPWKTLQEEHPVGSIVQGTIKGITDFGLFVDFGSFTDGLVRKGDVSWLEEVDKLEDTYKVGDSISAKVLRIDEDKERVSLGIKQLEKDPWQEITKLLPQGKVVDVQITAINKQGLEVALPLSMKGTIPSTDLDPAKAGLDMYNIGDMVTATVVKADNREKIVILSIKKYLQDSERRETKEYMKKMETSDDNSFGNIFMDKFDK